MKFKLPNFLIIGAAKCGTSSFYYHLRNHPQIFMSSVKEPHHFSSQNVNIGYNGIGDHRRPYIQNFKDYCRLFEGVQDEIAIGESSTDTIDSWPTSIPAIQNRLGDPKIIVLLRNPVDRAYSAYLHLIRENRENTSFEEGLLKEEERIANNWHGLWHYKHRGLYFSQVKPFINSFSRLKVFLTEDFYQTPKDIICQACNFLEVNADYESPYANVRYNTSGVPRFRVLNQLFVMKNPVQRFIRMAGHAIFTEDKWIALRDSTRARIMVKPKMKPETRAFLNQYFREDILQLQDLLQRDLSIWLN